MHCPTSRHSANRFDQLRNLAFWRGEIQGLLALRSRYEISSWNPFTIVRRRLGLNALLGTGRNAKVVRRPNPAHIVRLYFSPAGDTAASKSVSNLREQKGRDRWLTVIGWLNDPFEFVDVDGYVVT